MTVNKPKSFNEYLIGFDEAIQLRLSEIRNAMLEKFPDVEESIRYNMTAFKLIRCTSIFLPIKNI